MSAVSAAPVPLFDQDDFILLGAMTTKQAKIIQSVLKDIDPAMGRNLVTDMTFNGDLDTLLTLFAHRVQIGDPIEKDPFQSPTETIVSSPIINDAQLVEIPSGGGSEANEEEEEKASTQSPRSPQAHIIPFPPKQPFIPQPLEDLTPNVQNIPDQAQRSLECMPSDLPIPIRAALVYCLRVPLTNLPLAGSNEFWKVVVEILIASVNADDPYTIPQTTDFSSACEFWKYATKKYGASMMTGIEFAATAIITGCIHGFQAPLGNFSAPLSLDEEFQLPANYATFDKFVANLRSKAKGLPGGRYSSVLTTFLKKQTKVHSLSRLSRDAGKLVIEEIPVEGNDGKQEVTLEELIKGITNEKWKYWAFGRALVTNAYAGQTRLLRLLTLIGGDDNPAESEYTDNVFK